VRARLGLALLGALALFFGALAVVLTPDRQRADGRRSNAPPSPSYERVSVRWESLGLSNDSRTIWASASYAPSGFCVKRPDGMDLKVTGSVAYVSFWMRGPNLPLATGTGCSDDCRSVSQVLVLNAPLDPAVTSFRFASDAEVGCAARDLPERTPVRRRS
jgi:hypothetical protein